MPQVNGRPSDDNTPGAVRLAGLVRSHRLLSGILGLLLMGGCGTGSPPGRIIQPDVVGLVAAVHADREADIIELEDGQSLVLPESSIALNGSGINAGNLILYGEDDGRSWFAVLDLRESHPEPDCYVITGLAFDQPEAVIIVSDEWRSAGLRIPKRAGFIVPPEAVDSKGRFFGGELPYGSFCVDATGAAFALR